MKAYDPLKDGDAIACLELLAAHARQNDKREELPDSMNMEVLIDKRLPEKSIAQSPVYLQEDLALLEKSLQVTGEELIALKNSAAYKACVKRVQRVWLKSDLAEAMGRAINELIPDEVIDRYETNYDALQCVIDVLSQLSTRPEIAPVSEVVIVLEGVCRALSQLKMLDADMFSIAESFAYPAHSFRNSRAASMIRTDKDNFNDAYAVWKRWVADPSLYKTKAAFSRDLIRKEYCADSATPTRWIRKWAVELPAEHALREKIVVKARSK